MQPPVTVNSLNLFVDTDRTALLGHPQNKGDDVSLHFEGNSIEAGDGEQIRISLRQFNMFNNLFMVNANNARFRVVTSGPSPTETPVPLTYRNHKTLGSLAEDFGIVLGNHLADRATGVHQFAVLNGFEPTKDALGSSPTRILQITLQAQDSNGTPVPHNLTKILVQCHRGDGDSYALLGAKALDAESDTESSFDVKFEASNGVASNTDVTITGFFPMQRMTEQFVYIRCGQNQNSLESSVLSSDAGVSRVDIVQSNILAKATRDVEFIHYDAQTCEEYTITLQQRRLSTLRLFLTDSKGRPLGRVSSDSTNGTAAGSVLSDQTYANRTQSTAGNLFFNAVIKIDVVHVQDPKALNTAPPRPPMPAREAQAVVTWPDYGRPKI